MASPRVDDDGDVGVDVNDPAVRREIDKKRRLMAQANATSKPKPSTPGHAPGQHAVRKWVVLDLGKRPSRARYDPWGQGDAFSITFRVPRRTPTDGASRPETSGEGAERDVHMKGERERWNQNVRGRRASEAERSRGFVECAVTLGELRERAGGEWVECGAHDWHCVTGWSALGLRFRGVPLTAVLSLVSEKMAKAEAGEGSLATDVVDGAHRWTCLFQTSADGYTAGVHRDDAEDAFLAVTDADGSMLAEAHGGPRIVFPRCYGWKSNKFLTRVDLLPDDAPGFWEKLGCHPRGRWALEERWAPGTSSRVWNLLAWITDQYRVFGGERVWEFVMVRGGRCLGWLADVRDALFDGLRSLAARAEEWGERDRRMRRKRRKAWKTL